MPKVGDACWFYPEHRMMKMAMDEDDNNVPVELTDPRDGKPFKVAIDELFTEFKGMPVSGTVKKVRDDGTVDVEIAHRDGKGNNGWIRRRVTWGKPTPATDKRQVIPGPLYPVEVVLAYASDPG